MSNNLPNVILICSEDHGPHFGCHGDPNARTPFLDQLAAAGVRFDSHHTTCAICSPGRASLLTGLYPHQNGQINLATHQYGMYRPFANLVSILKEHGYRTGRIGKLHVLPEEAFPFDFVWRDPERISFQHRDVFKTAEVAGDFAANGSEPFLLYACFADAHLPELHQSYGVPENPLSGDDIQLPDFCPIDAPHIRDRLAGYYNCLERLDKGVELLVEAVRKQTGRETIVIFTTDHGQQFIRGKVTCYEGGLRVPLILNAPGRISAGLVRKELTSHVDILPTLLEMLGLPAQDNRPGRSLMPLANGRDVPWREHVVGQWTGWPGSWFPQRSIRDKRYKLIINYMPERDEAGARYYLPPGLWETSLTEADFAAAPEDLKQALQRAAQPPREELYDLHEDPQEIFNLAGEEALQSIQNHLRDTLAQWQTELDDRIADPEVLAALAEMHEHIERDFYPEGVGPPRKESTIPWDYGRWIDPGVPV
ncbi:MAG: sulfatase [Planctomycetota bacterium]|nr:sulfatase [Planctomycetota bacterium]